MKVKGKTIRIGRQRTQLQPWLARVYWTLKRMSMESRGSRVKEDIRYTPTLLELGEEMGLTKSTAWKAVKMLEERGYVRRTRQWRGIEIL